MNLRFSSRRNHRSLRLRGHVNFISRPTHLQKINTMKSKKKEHKHTVPPRTSTPNHAPETNRSLKSRSQWASRLTETDPHRADLTTEAAKTHERGAAIWRRPHTDRLQILQDRTSTTSWRYPRQEKQEQIPSDCFQIKEHRRPLSWETKNPNEEKESTDVRDAVISRCDFCRRRKGPEEGENRI